MLGSIRLPACGLAVALVLLGCASPKRDDYAQFSRITTLPADAVLAVQLEPADTVQVRGAYDPDDSTGAGGMLYSGAAGAGGVLAQVLVHAAVSNSAQASKLAAQQQQADKVLQPFQEKLAALTVADLEHSDDRYQFSHSAPDSGWVLVSKPIFYLSQDGRRVSILNIVEVKPATTGKEKPADRGKKKRTARGKAKPAYSNVVEVLGPVLSADSATAELMSDTSSGLKQQISLLYRQSLDLAVKDIRGTWKQDTGRQLNHRVGSGEATRFERGTSVERQCGTEAIRNLRGWIVSFPLEDAQASCEALTL